MKRDHESGRTRLNWSELNVRCSKQIRFVSWSCESWRLFQLLSFAFHLKLSLLRLLWAFHVYIFDLFRCLRSPSISLAKWTEKLQIDDCRWIRKAELARWCSTDSGPPSIASRNRQRYRDAHTFLSAVLSSSCRRGTGRRLKRCLSIVFDPTNHSESNSCIQLSFRSRPDWSTDQWLVQWISWAQNCWKCEIIIDTCHNRRLTGTWSLDAMLSGTTTGWHIRSSFYFAYCCHIFIPPKMSPVAPPTQTNSNTHTYTQNLEQNENLRMRQFPFKL